MLKSVKCALLIVRCGGLLRLVRGAAKIHAESARLVQAVASETAGRAD